jgi:hypothetical protein
VFIDLLIRTIVFLLPTQLGLHFWPAFSRVAGIKIDYLSPTLYFVDLLLLILILATLPQIFALLKKYLPLLFVSLTFILLNTLFAVSPLNTLFWWLRNLLYFFTFISLKERHLSWKQIEIPLLLSTLFLLFIQIFQTLTQSSLGRFLYLFGERAYSSSTPGLARLNLFGFDFVRAPATFSHPNSLAGYLLVVFYLFSQKSIHQEYRLIPFLGILLTLSKTAIITLAFLLIGLKPEILIFSSLFITLLEPFLYLLHSTWQPLSDRLFFFSYLHKIIKNNPFTGVGLGGFIPALGQVLPGSFLTPGKLQPIHNLFYLYLSEFGFLGLLPLVTLVIKNKFKSLIRHPQLLGLLAIILFTGVFDHYTWTLPQNKLILLFTLAILL